LEVYGKVLKSVKYGQFQHRLTVHQLTQDGVNFVEGTFKAMANPCQILIQTTKLKTAKKELQAAYNRAQHIEKKWSRYRQDSIVHQINLGQAVTVDAETAKMLHYADYLWHFSKGHFDITSGVLRKIWQFKVGGTVPSQLQIQELLQHIGWQKVQWRDPIMQLPKGMQIDFGGIGKEYAVDCALQDMQTIIDAPILVNFGGDIAANAPPSNRDWQVAIATAKPKQPTQIRLKQGAIATSGSVYQYINANGKRYSHILNATTGWAVADAPLSVSVIADNCTQAGMLATMAMLHGSRAQSFLQKHGVKYHIEQ